MNETNKIYETILGLYNNRRFKEVEKFYEVIISEHSDNSKLLNILASSFIQNQEYIKAIDIFERLIILVPEQQNINLNLGNLYRLTGNADKAIDQLSKALNLGDNNFASHYNLALAYQSIQEFENSINHYEESLNKLTIHQKELTEEVGKKYLEYLISLGKTTKALSKAKELILKCPKSDTLLGLLGNLYAWKGDITLAIDQYYKALKINKNNKSIKYDLSFCLRKKDRLNDAIDILRDLNYLNSRAFYIENLFLNNQKDEFINKLKEACKNYPGNRLLANLSKFSSILYGFDDDYPFCKEPFSFIYKKNILDKGFVDSLTKEIISINIEYSNQDLITNGKQSAGNLFSFNSKNINNLEKIINQEILNYRDMFRTKDQYFINNWPKNSFLNSWYIDLMEGGSLGYHYHHGGWISGSLYLKMPKTENLEEGSIEFSYNSSNYKEKINSLTKVYKPEVGDIIIFPSSLNHRVNPFEGKENENRISIAFDLVPSI